MFADHVMFYGTPKSKTELVKLKWDYLNKRWPTRSFDLVEETLQIMPSGLPDEYEVSFNAYYNYKGRGKTAGGLAFFDFTMKKVAGRLVIVRENGRAIERF